MRENVPGSFPYTAGVFAFKRENEDPTRMFAGEGDAFRTNRASSKVSEGMPAKRLSTAFDSVTLYGCDPDRAPGHLRQGRQLRRLDRHARRPEGALLRLRPVRPDDLGVDDHQRPGADDPGHVPQHRHRPADRQVRDRQRPRADRGRSREDPRMDTVIGARHGAGRHPQGGPGPEHLHLLDRIRAEDDGRHSRSSSCTTRSAISTRCRFPAITSPKPAPTRSPSSPSRWPTASPTSRPIWRAACTSTTSPPTCPSSSATAWTRNTR